MIRTHTQLNFTDNFYNCGSEYCECGGNAIAQPFVPDYELVLLDGDLYSGGFMAVLFFKETVYSLLAYARIDVLFSGKNP